MSESMKTETDIKGIARSIFQLHVIHSFAHE